MDLDKDQVIENSLLLRALLHDLVNPLSVIASTVSLLQEMGEYPPQSAMFIDKIQKAAQEQVDIIEKTKALRKYLAGQDPLPLKPLDLDDIFRNVARKLGSQLTHKNIHLSISIEEDEDALILGEKAGFETLVIEPLLSNAIRYSYPNSNVDVTAKRQKDLLELRIKDQGTGIPEKVLKNMFDIKSRLRKPDVDGNYGLGLSMPLLKYYLDRCGVGIRIESKEKELSPQKHGTEVVLICKAP
jgi:K+-sensing histidine kinase KdpD